MRHTDRYSCGKRNSTMDMRRNCVARWEFHINKQYEEKELAQKGKTQEYFSTKADVYFRQILTSNRRKSACIYLTDPYKFPRVPLFITMRPDLPFIILTFHLLPDGTTRRVFPQGKVRDNKFLIIQRRYTFLLCLRIWKMSFFFLDTVLIHWRLRKTTYKMKCFNF